MLHSDDNSTFAFEVEGLAARSVWRFPARLRCQECRERLDAFQRRVLATAVALDDDPVTEHLQACPSCAQLYVQLLSVETAPQVVALEDARLDPTRAPGQLDGLLSLWRLSLARSEQLGDLACAAFALSTIGMLHRARQDFEEARLVHDLALVTAAEAEDWQSAAISETDLAWIELTNGSPAAALPHIGAARGHVEQLGLQRDQSRLALLELDVKSALAPPDPLESYGAARRYEEMVGPAQHAGDSLGLEIAITKIRAAYARLQTWRPSLGAILEQVSQPVFAWSDQPGAPILNTGGDVQYRIIKDPVLSAEGMIGFSVWMDVSQLPTAVPLFLDVFLANELITTREIGADLLRLDLGSPDGLWVTATPLAARFPIGQQVPSATDASAEAPRTLPASWLSFRVWHP